MPAPATVASFLDFLTKSGLHPPGELERYLAGVQDADTLPAADLAGRMVRDGFITHFQAGHLLQGRYKNFFIGKFKVIRPLGRGGMSQVFLCEHTTLKHRVALKLLPVKESKDPAAVGRFQREARAAASVNHPNVVRAHDFDQSADGRFYYLVMDYVDGVNLHDLVERIRPLPAPQAAQYVAQAAAGLQHIHECGLVHRDIKPGNLLLDRDGVVRILDLGLVRYTADESDNLTRRLNGNTVLGTADYLAPEQAMQADDLDIRADIYSLGATFYYLLTGAAPFQDLPITQKLMAHQLREPAPIPGLPPELAGVLVKMMRKEPKERFSTPDELLAALAPLLGDPLPVPDPAYFPDAAEGGTGPRTGRPGPPSTRATGVITSLPRTGLVPPLSNRTAAIAAPAAPPPAANTTKWLVIGGVAAAAVLAAAVLALNPFGGGGSGKPVASGPTAPVPNRPPLPADAVGVGPGEQFPTVAAALAAAKPGSRVLLTAPDHAEELAVGDGAADVTVQGWPEDRPVVWRRPDGAGGRALVAVSNVAGFGLANIKFEGKGVDTLVAVSGQCPGLVLDGVTGSGFKSAAVGLVGLQAAPARPAVVRRLRAIGPGEAGVLLDGPCRNILLDRCRFEGQLRAGVRAAAPVAVLTVRTGRFDGLGAGVSLAGDAAGHQAAVLNSTFANCEVGLLVEAVTVPAPKLVVRDNLFFRTAAVARATAAESKPVAPDGVEWVWHDDGLPKDKQTIIPAGVRYFRKAFDLPTAPADAVLDIGCVTTFQVWVNGTKAGASEVPYFNKRVYAFPVGKLLKPGTNVIAVEGSHGRDPVNSGYATAAGLVVRLTAPGQPAPLAVSDASWKSADQPATGWQAAGFDDASWKPVKLWNVAGFVLPWQGSVWDSVVRSELKLPSPLPFASAGNVRDYTSQDGFPLLNTVRGFIPGLAGTDPANDATYLRTPRTIERLYTLGADGGPVGVPLD